jgi:uncharacterized protein
MQVEEKFNIKAPIQEVWNFSIDPDKLGPCIPGLEEVERVDDRTYNAVLKVKVGPVVARFKFILILTEIDPIRHLKLEAHGADIGLSKGGSFSQVVDVDLRELTKDEVEFSYKVVVNVVGKFATFGERIMRAKGKDMGSEFAKNVKERIEAQRAQVN